MIKPTIGRIVIYVPFDGEAFQNEQAAIIAHVHSDRMVNLTVFDPNGIPRGETSVHLMQPEDDVPQGAYCKWMPYQVKKETGSESGEKQAGTESV